MAKYLEDKRRRLQGKQTGPVQKQPVQYAPKTQNPVQTQAAAPAPVQKQTAAPAPTPQATPQRALEQQAGVINQVPPQQVHTTAAAPAQTGTSDVVAQAQDYLNQQLGSYNSRYGSQITDLVAQLQNRPAFEYDVNTDPLYLQLRDIWKQDGLMAMEDTMGQAAQLTGGYGNSHAQMAGQQVYNNYLREVAEIVPQLKEAARADYDADTDALLRQYNMLMEQDSSDYARWLDEITRQYQAERDALADQRYDQEWQYQQDRDALADQRYDQEWQYQQDRDALVDRRYQDELAYGREQDEYGRQQDAYDRLLELIIATGYKPTAEELAAAGMTEAEAKAWRNYYEGTIQAGGGSSGGSSGGSRRSSGAGSGSRSGGGGGGNNDKQSVQQNRVPTRQELGDPLKKEDYVTVYANCSVFAGNGASASELATYIKDALRNGSITQEQYKKLMTQFGNLVDPEKNGNVGSPRGGGSTSRNDRYNAIY